jgi:type I restriction enzyme S subunit
MSALPKGWANAPLHQIASTTSGGTPSRSRHEYYGGSIPWIKSGELNDGLVDSYEESITDAGLKNSSAKLFPSGTLCVALYGATVGKLGILGMDAATNQAVCGISPASGIGTKYLFNYLLSQRANLIDQSQGGAQPNISQGIIRATEVPIAPEPEQTRIVAEIEKQFTRLDAATAAMKRAQANLKRYRASVLKAACEGRLVPTEAALARKEARDYEPASELLKRILRERRARWEADTRAKMIASGKPPKDDHWKEKYKEPAFRETSGLSGLPEGWCWASVESLSTKVVDGVHKKPDYVQSGIPFITVRNLTAGPGISFEHTSFVTEQDHAEFIKRANPELGDILVSKDGTLGTIRAIRTDRIFSIFVSVAMIKPVLREMSDFLEIALMSPQVQIQMVPKGSGLQHIHLEDLREDCIPIPPLAEQARIIEECARRLSILDNLEGQLPRLAVRGASLRNSILSAAFSGRLAPQDSTEEPASVLLDRIRAERVAQQRPAPSRKRREPAHV